MDQAVSVLHAQPKSTRQMVQRSAWALALAIVMITVIVRGLGTYSLLKGVVAVGFETTFRGMFLFGPLAHRALYLLLGALAVSVTIIVLRYREAMTVGSARILLLLVTVLCYIELGQFQSWGRELASELEQWEIVVEAPGMNALTALQLLDDDFGDLSVWVESQRPILRVPPCVTNRVPAALEALRSRGVVARPRNSVQ